MQGSLRAMFLDSFICGEEGIKRESRNQQSLKRMEATEGNYPPAHRRSSFTASITSNCNPQGHFQELQYIFY